ncbi:MAG: hypothetical protein ACRDQF_10335 [Thermocrispum sp.]
MSTPQVRDPYEWMRQQEQRTAELVAKAERAQSALAENSAWLVIAFYPVLGAPEIDRRFGQGTVPIDRQASPVGLGGYIFVGVVVLGVWVMGGWFPGLRLSELIERRRARRSA